MFDTLPILDYPALFVATLARIPLVLAVAWLIVKVCDRFDREARPKLLRVPLDVRGECSLCREVQPLYVCTLHDGEACACTDCAEVLVGRAAA